MHGPCQLLLQTSPSRSLTLSPCQQHNALHVGTPTTTPGNPIRSCMHAIRQPGDQNEIDRQTTHWNIHRPTAGSLHSATWHSERVATAQSAAPALGLQWQPACRLLNRQALSQPASTICRRHSIGTCRWPHGMPWQHTMQHGCTQQEDVLK
jgi:hypothetical protein